MKTTTPTTYALASGLVGFPSTQLRVQVRFTRDGLVWCVTADLLSAGCPLVLDAAQVVAL